MSLLSAGVLLRRPTRFVDAISPKVRLFLPGCALFIPDWVTCAAQPAVSGLLQGDPLLVTLVVKYTLLPPPGAVLAMIRPPVLLRFVVVFSGISMPSLAVGG